MGEKMMKFIQKKPYLFCAALLVVTNLIMMAVGEFDLFPFMLSILLFFGVARAIKKRSEKNKKGSES